MDVYINGELVANSDGDARLAAQQAQKYLAPGVGFGRAWVDGVAYAGVTSLPEIQDAPAQRLDLEALSANELAQRTATSVLEYLGTVVPYIEALASSLRFNEARAIEKLVPLVPAFDYIEAAERGVRAADEMNGSSGAEAPRSYLLRNHLEEVVAALERSDAIEAADILEYVIGPELEAIQINMRVRLGTTRA